MPIQNSPQYEDLTTSNEGRNVRASLQMTSHFFLEDNSFSQIAAESFGAISSIDFTTTSKVTFSGIKKVYAICQGQVFVQPQIGSNDKVNVILKPFKQPISGLGIKYFVYRGLNKSDFFSDVVVDGVNRLKITGSETSGSDFVKYIWKEFNRFYSSNPSNQPVFLEEFIGFPGPNSNQQLSDFIDEYFYKIVQYDSNADEEMPQFAYELPLIPRGTQLGNATGEVGIDVVLNNGDYYIENDSNPFQFNLEFARSPYHRLTTQSAYSDFQNKLIREMCTQFIDIASFYGLHASGNGKLYIGSSTSPVTSAGDVYTQIQNFYTKNTVYLYIQSERLRSYNFYGNYVLSDTNPNNIKIGNNELNLTETTFETSDWPVHKYEANGEILFFQLLTDNFSEASLFIQIGNPSNNTSHENCFIRDTNLLQEVTEDEQGEYTNIIGLQIPQVATNSIGSFIRVIYEGKQMTIIENVSNDYLIKLKDIDDTFGLLKGRSFVQATRDLELTSVIDNRVQLINFQNAQNGRDIGTVLQKRTEDVLWTNQNQQIRRITYETISLDVKRNIFIYQNPNSYIIDSSSANPTHYEEERNNYYQPDFPYYIITQPFIDSGEEIMGLLLKITDGSIATKKILGLKKEENHQLISLIDANNISNPQIFFRNLLTDDDDVLLSPEGISYNIYHLNIIGESINGDLGIYTPSDNIIVYSLDNLLFFSKEYSQYMIETQELLFSNFNM